MSSVTRRTLARGAVWSIPTVAVSTLVPAYAASARCVNEIDPELNAYFQRLNQLYTCNGQPFQLEANLYQPLAAADGASQDVYVNFKNLSTCTFPADQVNLTVTVDVVSAVNVTGQATTRSVTSKTSWGTTSVRNLNILNPQTGQVHHTVTWRPGMPIPGAGAGDNEADVRIAFSNGSVGERDYFRISINVTNPPPPTYAETGGDSTLECQAYYQERLAAYRAPLTYTITGPLRTVNGVTIGVTGLYPGTVWDSRVVGNNSTGLATANKNGIF